MTTYTRPLGGGTPTTGQVVKAVHVNDPIDQIYDTIFAGGITADQIAAGAVDTAELATAAVTAAKMDGTLPDASAMATATAPTTDAQLANKKYIDDEITTAAAGAGFWKTSGATVLNATMAAATTFQDLDLSGTVGSNAALVFLEVSETQGDIVVVKPKGFGGIYTKHSFGTNEGACINDFAASSQFCYFIVATDSSGVIQIAASTNSSTITVKLIGYVK